MRIVLSICLLAWMGQLSAQASFDITPKKHFKEKKVLSYPALDERDVFWEKKVYRIIDTRQKINLPFRYPAQPLIQILEEGITNGEVQAYAPGAEMFDHPLDSETLQRTFATLDTVRVIQPDGTEEWIPIENRLNYEDVHRYRIAEIWYFDSQSSTLKVRIMGIAPLKNEVDEWGNFLYETPMFWVHVPSARSFLARYTVMNPHNQADQLSWEQYLERRQFEGYVYKEDNLHDRRLQDYLSGVDLLSEAEQIDASIFSWESDLWSR
ncbi:MAG: gliding motility protein GldN [Saprospiraceae bacterium]|nr:gliding motility protein GldN [Saprospiraceae bacterium]